MYSGIIPAFITPFTSEGEVNLTSVKEMLDWLLGYHITGVYITGSTGEGLLLSVEERQAVVETAIEKVAGSVPVIVHVGAPATATAETLARHAREVGADAVASVPPMFYAYNKREIENYYFKLKQASDLPVYFYNIPALTNHSLDVELASNLFHNGVIDGMKYTHHDMLNFRGIIEACEEKLNIFSGPDEMLLPFLTMGAHGGIGATYSAMPYLYVTLFNAWQASDLATAQKLQHTANRVISTMAKYGIIPAVKAVMQFHGIDCGAPRQPFLPLTDEQKTNLKADLTEIGFFDIEEELLG